MDNIDKIYIPTKATGDTLSAVEFNKVPSKINEIIDYLGGNDERTRQIIAQTILPSSQIRVMTTQEYMQQGTWDTRILYACVDDGELTSIHLGLFTIARAGETPAISDEYWQLFEEGLYYTKANVDNLLLQKQNTLTAGKDIYINNDVIDNEHEFFTNDQIQDIWNRVDINS